jgi:hypothetical protein
MKVDRHTMLSPSRLDWLVAKFSVNDLSVRRFPVIPDKVNLIGIYSPISVEMACCVVPEQYAEFSVMTSSSLQGINLQKLFNKS